MDNKNENWRKKNTWNQSVTAKGKKGRKIKNLGIIELKIKKNTFFPIIKNHNSITTPKKNQSLSSDEKNRWFINLIFLLLFFLSCSLPPIVFLSNFWQILIMLLLDHYYYILLLLYANVQSVFNAYQITFWI